MIRVPTVPSYAVLVHSGQYCSSRSRYSWGTLLALFGWILLAMAVISLRQVTCRLTAAVLIVAPC